MKNLTRFNEDTATASIGGFYEWDSVTAKVVTLDEQYDSPWGVTKAITLFDSETQQTVLILNPETIIEKLQKLLAELNAQ